MQITSARTRSLLVSVQYPKYCISRGSKAVFADLTGRRTDKEQNQILGSLEDRSSRYEWEWIALPPILYVTMCYCGVARRSLLRPVAMDRDTRYPESVDSLRLDAVSEILCCA
ncbi:hypothetical protein ACMFMF_000362 [Clarireedia jacksonii]